MTSTHGYLRRDDALHWYLVPESCVEDFDAALEKIEGKEYLDASDDFDQFEHRFGKYRTEGLMDLRVQMP